MCSRETHRLPTARLQTLLGAKYALPAELRSEDISTEPKGHHIVLYGEAGEFTDKNVFFLLEIRSGQREVILDRGEAGSITMNGAGYQHFVGNGQRLGRYEYYCPLGDRSRTRLKPFAYVFLPIPGKTHSGIGRWK